MSRRLFPRVTLYWVAELLFLFAHLCAASAAGRAHTCREVKTAFQLRHIGPLKWVPETPATDVNLQVCKHVGPSCCTRKMEESYKLAAKRDILQNIKSYSFELRFLLLEYATAFQDTYESLFSFSQSHLISLFESFFPSLASPAALHVTSLFSDLSLFIQNTANISVEATVQRFYDHLFPLVHTRIINPDITETTDRSECLRATRHDVNPFGHHAQVMSEELADALLAARALTQAFSIGGDVMNSTEAPTLTNECVRALLKMQYCPHCRGLTLIRPCPELCLNVMRGCLASMADLNMPWRQYVAVLEDLTHIVAGEHNLELSLLKVRYHVNEAILHAQLHGARVSATVDKVCGQSTAESRSVLPTSVKMIPTVTDAPQPTVNQSDSPVMEKQGKLAQLRSSLPLKPTKNQKDRSLKQIAREFMKYIWRNKAFFAALPEMLCEGEIARDELTCWSGDDVVDSYKGGVVGNGVHAQRQNPEVKVRGPDSTLMEAKDKLEHFIQEIQKKMAGVGHRDSWEDPGSGEESSGDCDDEDGCQGSGEVTTKSSNPGPSTEAEVVMKPPPHDAPVIRSKSGSRSAATPLPHPSFVILILILTLQWILK